MELHELREQLTKIDEQLAYYFEKRMEIIENVRQVKITNNLPILDANREQQMIEKYVKLIKNSDIEPYYVMFLQECLKISKLYMQNNFKK